ncbi:conserved hypothetical protein [Histoplasma capsulatum G186AR]|uniref:Aminoglycoside phosphotransferase domain-containing protein n=2 Tax=Ajellomyces capsulatus TaxID=5037 RepID=C0NJ39_AJECG|nr:uncharacterized protein HCBG_03169 [Histoplasma capsulatum G186AR]EEH07880.1 conserved hypothetical protein [Histoplasma capsulatum G186AR]KAG5299786.1 hypothetical protein I7I52_10210 [Histoplasma capsulatum]QSS67587.1 hypothetical protein I7I50_06716 [Histoplasma capsulatum G186AR]
MSLGVEAFEGAFITAQDAIYEANLSSFEHLSLSTFLIHSRIPATTGQYVLDRISQNPKYTAEEVLLSIRADLNTLVLKCGRDDPVHAEAQTALHERGGHRCCITGSQDGVKPTYIFAPSILRDPDFGEGAPLRLLLEAILTKDGVERLFTLLGSSKTEDQLQNLWLMGPSIRKVFRHGHIYIVKSPYLEGTNGIASNLGDDGGWRVELQTPGAVSLELLDGHSSFYKTPSTADPESHPLPAEFLLNAHYRLFINLHMYLVELGVKKGWQPIKQGWTIGRVGRFLLRNFLSILPSSFRITLYNFIDQQIDYRDPTQAGSLVKLLPLGLCLKRGRANTENEASALQLVENHCSINAPKLIDHVIIDEFSGFILMTRIDGYPLNQVMYRTTYEEREQIGKDLAKWIDEFRQIPNKSKHLIAGASGGPICDHLYEGRTPGPFNSTAEFADDITQFVFNLEQHKSQQPIAKLYKKHYNVCFTHSDLHLSNIIVQDGRLFGLIDWENAGFKPEYWEFVRALWPYAGDKRSTAIYRTAFGDTYEDEWEAEAFILNNSPFIVGG